MTKRKMRSYRGREEKEWAVKEEVLIFFNSKLVIEVTPLEIRNS